MKWNKIECVTFISRNISDAEYGFSFIDDSLLFIFRNFRNKNLYICLFPLLFFLLVVHSFLHLFNTFLIDDFCAKIRIHTRTPKTKDIPRATKMRRLQQPTKSALGSGKYISFDFYCGRWHSIPLGLLLNTSFSTDTDKH